MRFLKVSVVLLSFIIFNNAYSQNIIKVLKKYALIDIDQTSGLVVGDRVPILRKMKSGKIKKIGEIQIVKFAKGKCAGKIVAETPSFQVMVGDFIELSTYHEDNMLTENSDHSISSGPGDVGIEKGDSEIRFSGFYMKMVGTEQSSLETGAVQLSYGYFVTPQLQIGVAPQLMIFQGYGNGTYYIFSASAFFNYNFATSSKLIPYLSGQWYQDEFAPEHNDFLDYSYLNIGFGIRNFFTEFAALNTSLSYGFSLGAAAEGGILMIMSGLSFIF